MENSNRWLTNSEETKATLEEAAWSHEVVRYLSQHTASHNFRIAKPQNLSIVTGQRSHA